MDRKLKIVISDLHIGAGYAYKDGNYLEDFTADAKLVQFLHEIRQESGREQREVELIINGDLFEFLQIPAVENYEPQNLYPKEVYLDSSAAASVKRLDLIIEGHPDIFDALSDFMRIEKPQRRITIIKGNHDVNLYWPAVKNRLREALGATGPRASLLLFAEEFVSREKIYIEHGHQRTEKINRYPDFLNPYLPNQPDRLYYPPGSEFVINFFNEVEHKYWFADSVKPITALIWYSFRWDFDFAARTLLNFVKYSPGLIAGSLGTRAIGDQAGEAWLEQLEAENSRRELAQQYADDPEFRAEFNRQVQEQLGQATPATRSLTPLALPETSSDPVAMARAAQDEMNNVLHQAAEEIARDQGARVILFGHTHQPVHEPLEAGGVYLNTGCWLWAEDFADAPPEVWESLFKGALQPGDKLGRLTYARIDYDEQGNPSATLLDFAGTAAPPPEEEQPVGLLARIYGWLLGLLRIRSAG